MGSYAASTGTVATDQAGIVATAPTTHTLPDRTASSSVPHDPWTTYKPLIKRLYIEENMTLKEVVQVMETEHGFKATAKSYKRRLKAWGLTKYIKLKPGQDEPALREASLDSVQALSTRQRPNYVRLANGRLVDADSLAMHLRRKARRKNLAQRHLFCELHPPAAVCAPERFRVLEGVYASVRVYIMGRFEDAVTTSQDVDHVRGWNPHSGRWLRFSASVQAACQAGKMNDAIIWMRHAPEELGLLLRAQHSNILSHFFRFLAQTIRFIDSGDPDGAQFLKVVKALIRFGMAYLAQNAARLKLSASHPLYRLFESLTKVDDHELLQAAWKGWKIGCQSWYDMLAEDPATWTANIDYLNIASLGGCSVSELPSNMGDVLDKTVKRYEAEGLNHPKYLGSLWNKALYTELMSSDSAKNLCLKGDTSMVYGTVHQREVVNDANTGVPTGIANSLGPRRDGDDVGRIIQSPKRTVAVMEENFGFGSPLALHFIRESEHGMHEIGAVGFAAEMAEMAKRREMMSSPSGLQASASLDKEMSMWAEMASKQKPTRMVELMQP